MELWKDELGFEYISDFNTMKTLSVVGTATTDMCKPLLMEIGRTIGAYDRQIARRKAQEKLMQDAHKLLWKIRRKCLQMKQIRTIML